MTAYTETDCSINGVTSWSQSIINTCFESSTTPGQYNLNQVVYNNTVTVADGLSPFTATIMTYPTLTECNAAADVIANIPTETTWSGCLLLDNEYHFYVKYSVAPYMNPIPVTGATSNALVFRLVSFVQTY